MDRSPSRRWLLLVALALCVLPVPFVAFAALATQDTLANTARDIWRDSWWLVIIYACVVLSMLRYAFRRCP